MEAGTRRNRINSYVARYHQGFFRPLNPSKYNGNLKNIVYRSSWELAAMIKFDQNPAFVEWSSEEIIIPYVSPIDGKQHRYFPDFRVKKRDPKTGTLTTYLIEVKPKSQTRPPLVQHRATKRYLYEVKQWGVNEAKWNAAISHCADRGWRFMILTEEHLGIS